MAKQTKPATLDGKGSRGEFAMNLAKKYAASKPAPKKNGGKK